jgi:hypothetical protein
MMGVTSGFAPFFTLITWGPLPIFFVTYFDLLDTNLLRKNAFSCFRENIRL